MNGITLPHQLERMDQERLKRYRENLEFYNGFQWSTPARRRERHLTFNYAKAFVEKVTSYLMGELHHVVTPLENTPEAWERARRAQEALTQAYEDSALAQLDFDTEIDTAILGDGCYKVIWDSAEGRVRVTAPDVQGVFVWWVGDDVSQVWRVASRYQVSHEEAELLYGLNPTRADRLGSRPPKRVTVVEIWTAGEVELWVDNVLLEQKANPYGFIPFIIYPNLREPKQFWGLSDLPPIMEPARELNRALTQLSTILELSGNPIAVLENVEEAQDIAVQPGAVWELPERARAYLLDLLQGGGVRLHTDYIDLLYRTLHDLGETPRTAFGDNRQALSGVALEMELHPLFQKVKRKRLIRTAVYKRRGEMILRILEQKTGERFFPCRIGMVWGSVLPQDRGRLVADEVALVEAGIHSRRRAAQELGVEDPEGELERVREEKEDMVEKAVSSEASQE